MILAHRAGGRRRPWVWVALLAALVAVACLPFLVHRAGQAVAQEPTPTSPFISTPNASPTPKPTLTPTEVVPQTNPRMMKTPSLTSVFLTHQGDKIPPDTCLSGDDAADLEERLDVAIPDRPDPKDPSVDQQLGAFEFEVHYDQKKVCVELEPAGFWDNNPGNPDNPVPGQVICIIEDSVRKPALEGVARIGCVTVGKVDYPDTTTPEGRLLARVIVRPQPEVYSQAKPNQDNGVVVQINNTNCDISDLQGHAMPLSGCMDSDITFRYLEGDVQPDCVVDAVDAQAIAFRWAAQKGSLVYRDFMNLEPSGAQADNDIDVLDLQFVTGRFNSTCAVPHPPQPPVNPKQ